ncbi:MAG: DUF3667 domain-containing protein [Saprospiraceae bacterium]
MKIPESPPVPRITLRYIGEQILSQVNLEKGLGYTFKQLLLAPGAAIREYLFEDRSRMMRPLPLVLLLTAIATFLSFKFLPLEQSFTQSLNPSLQATGLPEDMIPLIELLRKLGKQYFNIILMSSIPGMALASYIMFKDKRLNYAEHLIINMYLFNVQTLLLIFALPLLVKFIFLSFVVLIATFIYFTYAFQQIFQIQWQESVWKAVLFIILSQLVQNIVVSMVAVIIWIFFL